MTLLAAFCLLTFSSVAVARSARSTGLRVLAQRSQVTSAKSSKKSSSKSGGSSTGSKGSKTSKKTKTTGSGSGGTTGSTGGSTSGGTTSGSGGSTGGGTTGGSGGSTGEGSTGGSGGSTGGGTTGGSGGSTGGGTTGGSGGSTGGSGGASTAQWIPPQHLPWYWQIQGTVNNNESVAAYDIDGFENTAAEVAALHAQGKHVICYIDVGTSENYRPDFASFPTSVEGDTNGWPGEKWLDIRQLSVLEPIMTARFQMCKEKGFDAVEPDNMDGYENKTGFPLTAAEQVTYDEWVASEVHSLGMAVFQKNDGEQTAQLEPHFDGALDEQCNQYSECSNFQAYLTAGKPVLNAEYELATSAFCAADNAEGIMGARYDLELDGKTFEPCW
ncbi:MAG TPA: endo alpha-1,4 polygalactosaminidase [Solirubrobacteraceae bacterium]